MDEIDKQIIDFLGRDGRMKLVDIGAALRTEKKRGYSHVGVKKRLLKLIDNDLIKIQANLNLEKLGASLGMVKVELNPGVNVEEYLKKYRECPRTLFALSSNEGDSIIEAILAESEQELNAYIDCSTSRNNGQIKDWELIVTVSRFVPSFFPAGILIPDRERNKLCADVDCKTCMKYRERSCSGCPKWEQYRGKL